MEVIGTSTKDLSLNNKFSVVNNTQNSRVYLNVPNDYETLGLRTRRIYD